MITNLDPPEPFTPASESARSNKSPRIGAGHRPPGRNGMDSLNRSGICPPLASNGKTASPGFLDSPGIKQHLERIAAQLTPHRLWHQDMVQEAWIHLWRRERLCPGQTKAWYLHSCRLYLRNWLRRGRSIDSLKRRNNIDSTSRASKTPERETSLDTLPDRSLEASVLQVVRTRDLLQALLPWLKPAEREVLACLAQGLGIREIARQLNVSHTWVIKTRGQIANLLSRLEPTP